MPMLAVPKRLLARIAAAGLRISTRFNERGLALVSVLWVVAILSVIATVTLTSSVVSRRVEANTWRRTEARILAEAAIARAVLALTDPRAEERWRVDGVASTFEFAGAEITVSIQDELGKIDLNTASEDLLRRLFHAAVADPDEADSLTDKVLDWRTPGSAKRLNGASEADYRSAGFGYRPRGSAFQAVGELKLVMGMTDEIFAKIEPAITVYSQRPTIDPRTAPRLALLALATMDEAGADATVAARAAESGTLDPAMGLRGRAFTVRAEIVRGAKRYSQEAVTRLTNDPKQPYWILAWKDG